LALGCIVLLGCLAGAPGCSPAASEAGSKAADGYDPARDSAADIEQALADATRTGRNVLLEVGGEWCSWCHILDKYFEDNADIRELRDRNFVMVKVNFSPENKNEQVLSRYPAIEGYPHFFVLDGEGKLLHSQNTGELEAGKSYDREKFTAFLKQWGPESARK
jgi:thiol:disulfide interchange protein